MEGKWLFLAGGTAAIAALASGWQYLKGWLAQLRGLFIVSAEFDVMVRHMVLVYVQRHWQPSRFGPRSYTSDALYVKPREQTMRVILEKIPSSGQLFWRGWHPVWISEGDVPREAQSPGGELHGTSTLRIYGLRGSFQPERLIRDAEAEYNDQLFGSGLTRWMVHYVSGTAQARQWEVDLPNKPRLPYGSGQVMALPGYLAYRPVRWRDDEMCPSDQPAEHSLDALYMDAPTQALVEELRFWKKHKHWYRERGIPWRCGVALAGPPGTGKTSFLRALSREFDFPIYLFDLATLTNAELVESWRKLRECAPCLVALEDVDSVFRGRENCSGGPLTFDCLLQCLDGLDAFDGVLVGLTSNYLDQLDEALIRPGRIDIRLELPLLNEEGRRLVAGRILADCPAELVEALVTGSEDMPGAVFQRRCQEQAVAWRRNEDARLSGHGPAPSLPVSAGMSWPPRAIVRAAGKG